MSFLCTSVLGGGVSSSSGLSEDKMRSRTSAELLTPSEKRARRAPTLLLPSEHSPQHAAAPSCVTAHGSPGHWQDKANIRLWGNSSFPFSEQGATRLKASFGMMCVSKADSFFEYTLKKSKLLILCFFQAL